MRPFGSAQGRVGVALVLGLMPLLAGCGGSGSQPDQPRLVILYAPCTVNRSFLSPYNPESDLTPELEGFAREGVVFERHWSEAGQSGVAFASLFAGAQAPVHGVFAHPTRIDDSVRLAGEVFADAGYESHFWGGHTMASGRWNYGQGADAARIHAEGLRADDPELGRIFDRLRAEPEYRVFIATNFTITHAPYSADHLEEFCRELPHRCEAYRKSPDAVRRYAELHGLHNAQLANDFPATIRELGLSDAEIREMADALELLYMSNIHRLDAYFGQLLDRVDEHGLRDESLIAFTADHGEALYREQALFKWNHGWELSPDVLRVPWIVRGVASADLPRRHRHVTRSIDVLPTLAGLTGLEQRGPPGRATEGVDLAPVLTGRLPPSDLPAFSHTALKHAKAWKRSQSFSLWNRFHSGIPNGEMWVSLRDEDAFYKYRNLDGSQWGFQAFDLDRDPHAEQNRFDPQDPAHRRAAARLAAYRTELREALSVARGLPPLEERDVEALRALGYIE